MNSDSKREMTGSLIVAGAILLLAFAGASARKAGYIDPETVTRIVTASIGLMIAWWGNRMPKAFIPNACARQVRRFGGWSMTLSGLIYAALFAFAPLWVAYPAGMAAIVAGIVVTFLYALALRSRRRAG